MGHDNDQLRADMIDQLSGIAFAQPSAFFQQGAHGQPFIDLTDDTPQQLVAVKDFQLSISQAPGRGQTRITRIGFKMHDRLRALDSLFKLSRANKTRSGRHKQNAT